MKKILLSLINILVPLLIPAASAPNADPEILKAKSGKRDYAGVFPAHVKTIAVITPASYPSPSYTEWGMNMLRNAGYKIRVMPHVFTKPAGVEKNSVLAIPVEQRVRDFEAAWNDKNVDMIICARGGRGTDDLVAHINWSKLPRRPELYVMGYSDVTFLLCAMSVKGYGRPVAGPVIASLPSLEISMIPQVKKMFHGEELTPVKLKTLAPGDCSGKMFACLLSRLAQAVRKNYEVSSRGKIIILESVRTTPEKIRTDLEYLLNAKFFEGAAGIVFGHIHRCGNDAVINKILQDFARKVKIPVYRGLPFGHTDRHMAIDFAREAVIKNGVIRFPAVKK